MMKQTIIMLMILFYRKGKASYDCDPCKCCKIHTRGATGCYSSDGHNYNCINGCIDGYFGAQCRHACAVNCQTCSDKNSCSKCKDGYYDVYGDWCYQCPVECLTCSNLTHCHICKEGFYSGTYLDILNYNIVNNCRYQCRKNCKSCSSYKTCHACKEGFYDNSNNKNKDCKSPCRDNCKSCTSHDFCTECKSGFYNGKQYINSAEEYNDCRHLCYENCKSCSSYYTCQECKSGYYNTPQRSNNGIEYNNCAYKCASACKSCMSRYTCTECNDGYYFHASENSCYRCNGNCSSCSSKGKCTSCIAGKYNNHFTDCRETCKPECKTCSSIYVCNDCVSGRYGTICQNNCSQGCFNGQCNKDNGHCTCKTGFHGNKCDKCQRGKYGNLCERNCPDGCKNNNCSRDGKCYACTEGTYGEYCTGLCSEGCENDSCTRSGECSICKEGFIGSKCDRCIDSRYGNKCDQNCSLTCLACESLTNCSVCIKRHWGNECRPCPTNCFNCSSEGICLSCDKGFHGQICNEHCNVNCIDRRCGRLTGHCSKGCIAGFYGNFCEMKCSPNCRNNTCARIFGECVHGCKAGYNGTKCTQSLELVKEGDGDMDVVTGAIAGGGVLVLIVILVIVITILIKKRRQGDKQDDNNKDIKTEDANMTYSEINDTNMTAENNHTDDNGTENENNTYTEIKDANLSTKSQETDNIYAKPIKPKRKTEVVKSLRRNSTEVTVNNPSYEKQGASQTGTMTTNKTSKPPIGSKPAQMYDNNVIPKPSAMHPTSHISHIEHDAALEIEEDIDCLSTRSKSVFLIEQKAAELDNVDTYYNVAAVIKRKITLDKLPDFVAKKTKKDFVDEFQTLPAMLIKPYVDSQKRENRSKNRYKGIYPYDDTRVVLKEGDSDYINASYIDGYKKNKAYIASIGPTYKYMGDMSAFWIMVWQENVGKIVMLTNLEEGGVPKCDQYWPEKDFSLMFANIQVTCHTEENYADYTFRSFSVQKDSIKREIVQVHFTAWPDKGTPDDVTSLIEFRQKVNSTKTKLDGPILVHCSAGIGRTGTYIALDSITNEGETEGAVDIYAFVRNMREQRVNMIQTAEQYQYLHNALVHTLTFDSKAVEASMFNEYMKTHTEDHLGNMFEKLQASVEQGTDDEQEAVKRNKALVNKNRNGADIPGDRNRPGLFIAKTPGQSDYINAVYVNSFKNVNRFLIAQTPLPDTVEDFLTLIVQEKVSCVISMETMSSANKDVGIYCPADNQTLRKGAFTIKTERGDGTDQYQLKKIKISYKSKSGSEEVIVPHVQYTQWDNNKSILEEPVKFVQFVKDMELKFSGTDTNRPMLVHCLTGAKKGGLFCVVSTLLEKTQIDQEVSVANTVRQIKYRRHLAVPDKDQYIFCHHCVNEYLRTFDIYSNFELKT